MPQVDKSASTYSPPVQYVPALPSRPELNKVNKLVLLSDLLLHVTHCYIIFFMCSVWSFK